MIFSLATKEDALQMASIHKTEMRGGFLSSLSLAFLKRFYQALTASSASFCVVAKEGDRVVGFIAGTTSLHKFYKYFLLRYFFQAIPILLPKIFSSPKKILESLLYSIKDSSLPSAELLTIAVESQFQGKGVASEMLKVFISEMKARGAKTFKVMVGEELLPALRFYEKNGFTFLKNINVHQGKPSRVYGYTI